MPREQLIMHINEGYADLSKTKKCKLLEVNRSSLYLKPKGESELNLNLMRLMDEHYLEHPEKGARSMHIWLTKDQGFKVSKNRIERLYYNVMGLRSLCPGPHTSKRNKEHKTYPYLLRDLKIVRPNQVWQIDITYIPMAKGFMYLVAIIDAYSRQIVGWSLSNSMDKEWCIDCVNNAIKTYGAPEILNTDQGSQFTSTEFIDNLKSHNIKISMDGKGRATDNAYIERFWRTIKYDKIYLNPPTDGWTLFDMVNDFIKYYNTERRHSSINDVTPAEKYFSFNRPRDLLKAA